MAKWEPAYLETHRRGLLKEKIQAAYDILSQCVLCPHRCLIAPGGHGRCRVRYNQAGELTLPFYGKLSAIAVDPIEKKPLVIVSGLLIANMVVLGS